MIVSVKARSVSGLNQSNARAHATKGPLQQLLSMFQGL